MDLSRTTDEEKLNLCRKYYYGGFLFLPFLWAINAIWFFNDAFRKPAFSHQASIRSYVIRSFIGATVWLVAIVAWVCVFQINRADWGATADYISFIMPKGIP